MGTRTLSNLLCAAMLAMASGAGAQAGSYEVVDLGTLPGGTSSNAHGINASGQVTGDSIDATGLPMGYVWSETGGMVASGTLGGPATQSWGINDSGEITGVSLTASIRVHAFLSQDGQLKDIHPWGQSSSGWTLNNAGDVVGWREIDASTTTSFLRLGDGQKIYGPIGSELFDITDADESHGVRAAGFWPDPDSGAPMAAVYDLDSDAVLLTTIFGEARGINQSGTIVGFSGDWPFVSTTENDYENPTYVAPLPGFTTGRFYEINDHGAAVGMNSTSSDPTIAVIYGGGLLSDVSTLLDPVSGAGWTISVVRDINNNGWMVGTGTLSGAQRGVLLRPTDGDGDGLSFHDERFVYATNPLQADTDGDGLDDGAEVDLETNPLVADSDGDGANDSAEIARGTDPLLPDTITVIAPNGGEVIPRSSQQIITWNTTGAVGANVRIVSRKGTSVGIIVASTPNDGTFEWLVPAGFPVATNHTIEISSIAIPTILDQGDAAFSVVASEPISGTITVLSPNGGESLLRGSTVPITWSSTGTIGSSVKIFLRRGTSGATLASSTPNDGHFDWTVGSYPVGTGYSIEISAVQAPAIIDASNATFSLTNTPPPSGSITVTAPNGGESYLPPAIVPITWATSGATGSTVQIVARSAGQAYVVSASTENDGGFEWDMPQGQAPGEDYVIEVRSLATSAIGDTSNAAFTVLGDPATPSISVIYPNGGESIARNATVDITWTSTGPVGGTVKITARKGTTSKVVIASTSNDGSYSWTVPANYPLGPGMIIEISSTATPSVLDTSNSSFTIAP